jgi:hypothetical protein
MSQFLNRFENQILLTKSILTEKKCRMAMKKGGLSRDDLTEIGDLIIECLEVTNQANLFPDAGEA